MNAGGHPRAGSESWKRIEVLLDETLELPIGERSAHLDRCCPDPDVRAEVEALLAADDEAGTFLDEGAMGYLPTLAEDLGGSSTEGAEVSPWIGRRVGPYHLRREIGSGGMGEVYEAYDDRLDRAVALKRVQLEAAGEDSNARRRFRREARLAAGLSHPAIVRIHDILDAEGEDWLVMEYLEGRSLADELKAGPLEEKRARVLAAQITAGLAAAHARGVIHRDLKPANVLITPEGEAKLLDFGLAKRIAAPEEDRETELTRKQQVLGTLGAMSPEQARGEALDERSDLFSLGSLLYEMLTGEHPFQGSNPAVTLTQVCTHRQTPVRQLDPAVSKAASDLVEGLLEKEPERRPRSAREVLDALGLAETLSAPRASPPLRGEKRTLRWAGGFVLILAGLLALVWLLVPHLFRSPPPAPPLYVAVTEPVIVTAPESAPTAEVRLAAAGVYSAILNGLSQLEGLAAVTPSSLEIPRGSALDAAHTLGAEEALAPRMDCSESRCKLLVERLAAGDGRVLWLGELEFLQNDLASLRTAVASRLREAYPELRPRADLPAAVSSESYSEYLRLFDAYRARREPRGAALVEAIAALRADEPDFLEVYLLEVDAARSAFHSSREERWLEAARERLAEARELAPRDPRVPAALFDTAVESGRWDLAEEALAALESLEPGGSQTLQRRAELLSEQGERVQALESMRAAARLRPSSDHLFNLALMEYREGEVAAARGTLEGLLKRIPEHYKGRSLLAQLELLAGSPERAVELFEELSEESVEDESDAPGLANLGTAYLLAGYFPEAAASLRRAYELEPSNAILALNLADALELTGSAPAARALYLETLELLEQDAELPRWQRLTVSGQALAHLGRHREGAAAVQEALRIAPDNPQVALESALVYTLTGDLNIAMVCVDKALAMGLGPHWFHMPWFSPLAALAPFREILGGGGSAANTIPGRQDE